MTKRQELARFEKAVRENDRASMFEYLATELRDAGFSGSSPFFILYDADGQPWKKMPAEMNAQDIIEYIDNRLGPMFAGWCRERPEFTTH
jgi:hypothetical protein